MPLSTFPAVSLPLSLLLPPLQPHVSVSPAYYCHCAHNSVVDLSPFMSPLQLAEQAVDLNLRLMKWRAAPQLDVGALAATRCLLLGET